MEYATLKIITLFLFFSFFPSEELVQKGEG